jgi:hypothetical protein
MQTKTKTTTTTPAPKSDAQPVQAVSPARPKLGAPASAWADYNAAISAAGIRFQDKLDADFVAKAQPVQAAHTPGPWTAILSAGDDPWMVAAEMPVARVPDYSGNAEANARLIAAAPALLAALETIHEAGRMSDQPRAVYCALIAQDALDAAGNQENLKARGTKREALLAALEQCLPYVDRVRAMSGGDGDLTALTARAAIASAKGQ